VARRHPRRLRRAALDDARDPLLQRGLRRGARHVAAARDPVAGILGDQQAATFGQAAFDAGESKNTYGTGNFLIFQTGTEIVKSENGLLTTVGYKLGDGPPTTRWRVDRRHRVAHPVAARPARHHLLRPEVEELATKVEDNGGVYFVPAFSGLFAPYWRPDARGAIVGLTRYANRNHIARAALEATAFQTREVLDAVNADSGVDLTELKVDGGMIANDTLMQFQADILGVPVVRPVVAETTALGAAYAAGLAVGFWNDLDELRANWQEDKRWTPNDDVAERERQLRLWKKAVTKSMDWVDADVN
jgi:glycerol kinase